MKAMSKANRDARTKEQEIEELKGRIHILETQLKGANAKNQILVQGINKMEGKQRNVLGDFQDLRNSLQHQVDQVDKEVQEALTADEEEPEEEEEQAPIPAA